MHTAKTNSARFGFWGNMWSSPVYNLAMDTGNYLGVKYNISFPWANVMQAMTVQQAFMITFILLLYPFHLLEHLQITEKTKTFPPIPPPPHL